MGKHVILFFKQRALLKTLGALLFLFCFSLALAEGSAQIASATNGLNQPLYEYNVSSSLLSTSLHPQYVILENANEVINVSLCAENSTQDSIYFEVWATTLTNGKYGPTGGSHIYTSTPRTGSTEAAACSFTATTTSLNPPSSYRWAPIDNGLGAGVYEIRLINDSANDEFDLFDISVTPNKSTNPNPSQQTGRLFAYNWSFNARGYSQANSTDANFYVLVPGGQANTNYVWQLDLQQFAGFVYDVIANALGVVETSTSRKVGYSVPFTGYTLSELYPIYLSYPANAQPEPSFPPTISNYRFLDSQGIDQVISPGTSTNIQDSGTFSFTSDIPGTAQIIIDANDDGVFGNTVSGVDDIYLYDLVVAGSNSITWDGRDNNGNVLPDGSYDAQLQVRIGEYHFVAGDAETSGGGSNNGLTIYRASSNTNLFGTPVFWDDLTGFDPERTGNGGSNLPSGNTSGPSTTGDFRHTWGTFTGNSFGNQAWVDTYTYGLSSFATTPASIDSSGNDTAANLGLAKNASVSGNVVTLDFYLQNYSSSTISNFSLTDDLDSVFGAANYSVTTPTVVTVGANSSLTVNSGFTGSGSNNLLTASNSLAAFETAHVQLVVTVSSITDQGFGSGLYYNSASLVFTPPLGSSVTELSTNGTNPDIDNVASNGTTVDSGVGSNDDDGNPQDNSSLTPIFLVNVDYGDAPDSAANTSSNNYRTLASDNGPSHTVNPNLKLGNLIDGDTGTMQNASATADDTSSTDDEDGVTTIPQLSTTSSTYSLNTSVSNNTANPAYLVAWLDRNKDGDFLDSNERSGIITIPSGTTNATRTLSWTGLTGLTTGSTFIRIRVSTDSSFATNPSSLGPASDGEVEDYAVSIANPPSSSFCAAGQTSYIYSSSDTPITISDAGTPTISSSISVPDNFFVADVNVLSITGTHTWMGDLDISLTHNSRTAKLYDNHCGSSDGFSFGFDDSGTPFSTGSCSTSYLSSGTRFTPTTALDTFIGLNAQNTWTLSIADGANQDGGALSAWTLELCEVSSYDYGDAPSSYGTASHGVLPSPIYFLGTNAPDSESFSLNATNGGADGTGDDNTASPDDEDGVSLSSFYQGNNTSISVTVNGSGAYLNAWIDWNSDGDFSDSGEKIATNVQDNSVWDSDPTTGVIGLSVLTPLDASPGTSYARFRWSSLSTNATGAVGDGEVEDYEVTIVGSDYGDAPDSYGDASHSLVASPSVYLGSNAPDDEASSLNAANGATNGTGDDNSGIPDDEDGVTLPSLTRGETAVVAVTVAGNGYLNAWIDWNADGDFSDSGEQVATNYQDGGVNDTNGATGQLSFSLSVPSSASLDTTYARFRWSSTASLSHNGATSDGEVEDYALTISGNISACYASHLAGIGSSSSSIWSFDNHWFDDSANGFDPQNSPSVSYTTSSILGSHALVLNAAGIQYSDGSFMNDSFTNLSMGLWVKPDDVTPTSPQIIFDEGGTGNGYAIVLTPAGQIQMDIREGSNQQLALFDFPSDGDWHHLAITYENGLATAYLDGIAKNTVATGFAAMASHGSAGGVGASFGGDASSLSTSAFQGQIDELVMLVEGLVPADTWFDYVNCAAPISVDYGDAPAAYGSARHVVSASPTVFLGSEAPDTESTASNNATATGDDTAGSPNDEDGFTSLPVLYTDDTSYSLTLSCTTGAAVAAWLDFNVASGFEVTEQSTASCVAGSATLSWTGLSGLSAGTTYLRIRTASSSFEIQSPTTSASNGEVEDYALTITAAPTPTNAPTICGASTAYRQTFGSGVNISTALPSGRTSFLAYSPGDGSDFLADGEYVLIANPSTPDEIDNFSSASGFDDVWHHQADHTGDSNGYMLLINGDSSASIIFRQSFDNLTVGEDYRFAIYIANVFPTESSGGALLPNLSLTATPIAGGTSFSSSTGDIAKTDLATGLTWLEYSLSFTALETSYEFSITDNTSSGSGNDFALDDFSFTLVCPSTDLAISKTVDTSLAGIITDADNSGNVTPGDTIAFTIVIENLGPIDATNVVVTDIVPAGYNYVSSSMTGGDFQNEANPSTTGLTWSITTLSNANSSSLSFQAVVQSSAIPSDYENTVTFSSSTPDSNSANDSASVTPDILRIRKYVCNESLQGDGTCDVGSAGASDPTDDFVFSVNGSPGDVLVYRIEYENFATQVDVFNFSDDVPSFTTLALDSFPGSAEVQVDCHASATNTTVNLDTGAINPVLADIISVCNGSILPNERGAVMFKATVN